MHDVPESVVGEAFDPATTAATASWRPYAPRSTPSPQPAEPSCVALPAARNARRVHGPLAAPQTTTSRRQPHPTSSPASARAISARVLSMP